MGTPRPPKKIHTPDHKWSPCPFFPPTTITSLLTLFMCRVKIGRLWLDGSATRREGKVVLGKKSALFTRHMYMQGAFSSQCMGRKGKALWMRRGKGVGNMWREGFEKDRFWEFIAFFVNVWTFDGMRKEWYLFDGFFMWKRGGL